MTVNAENDLILSVKDLSIDFPTGRVVNNVSLELKRGQTVGVVGESGSGKSMTSLAIMGLLPATATAAGTIVFNGDDLLKSSSSELRKIRGDRIAMIFQDPLSSLNPYFTVGHQIAEAYVAHRGGTYSQAKSRVIESMKKVAIPDPERRMHFYPHQFSGGMRQRIMIAMALICDPELIIADEPTTALDVTVQAQILQLLADIQQETNAAMLFITHDLAVISEIADSVTVMSAGDVVEQGTTREIFETPKHPYTKKLLAATPSLDDPVELPEPITTVEV